MKRNHGDGSIDPQGPGRFRIRYRVGGVRHAKTIQGSRADAAKALRQALKAADDGAHVAPAKLSLRQWSTEWLALKSRSIEGQTLDRYTEIMEWYVLPALGDRRLQAITPRDIDSLFGGLRLAPRTLRFVFTVFKACLATAVKKKVLATNPASDAERPRAPTGEVGKALDETELARLVRGFAGHPLYPLVATAAFTGMRKGEVLALQWSDIDLAARTISISRSVEETEANGRRAKAPKTERGRRTIEIDPGLAALLANLPRWGDLCFPSPRGGLRSPDAVLVMFRARAKALGFALRFHDLRATHATILLNKGVAIHTVAARLGDDPAVLLKWYAKRNRQSDSAAAGVIGSLTSGVL